MVAGSKVKLPMPFHKSPTPPPSSAAPTTKSSSQNKSSFSRSIAAYFPRSSAAQVQPRPPDVADLLRLIDDLRDRESRLKTQLLDHKLLKETVAILPLLENDIVSRDATIQRHLSRIEELEAENQRLTKELEEEKTESERKTKALEDEIAELKKTASYRSSNRAAAEEATENQEFSSSQRFLKALNKSLKKTLSDQGSGNQKHSEGGAVAVVVDLKRDAAESENRCDSEEHAAESIDSAVTHAVRSRLPRVPKPPPRPSSPNSPLSVSSDCSASENHNVETEQSARPLPPMLGPPPPPPPPLKAAASRAAHHNVETEQSTRPPPPPKSAASKAAPPPPPPPPKGIKTVAAKVRRVPEVAEFYHSLMRRESSSQSRRDSGCGVAEAPANARGMIGEIENRSSHLLAIKTDVETQGDFIRCLIKEVEGAAFTEIEDVVLFVKWLDDELSYLVDERAVLKHFDWPEKKADALREAAFGYCDMKKLESEASCFRDDPRQPCGPALKKMQALLEKLEHGVYNISRMRESATNRYKLFQIPVHWMLDNGLASQIKLVSVKLAMTYMKRVSGELETVGGGGPEEEELVIQGVRFAFRVHQFAGGFDVETMRAFQELRDKARSCHVHCHGQQQKFLCRSATC